MLSNMVRMSAPVLAAPALRVSPLVLLGFACSSIRMFVSSSMLDGRNMLSMPPFLHPFALKESVGPYSHEAVSSMVWIGSLCPSDFSALSRALMAFRRLFAVSPVFGQVRAFGSYCFRMASSFDQTSETTGSTAGLAGVLFFSFSFSFSFLLLEEERARVGSVLVRCWFGSACKVRETLSKGGPVVVRCWSGHGSVLVRQ